MYLVRLSLNNVVHYLDDNMCPRQMTFDIHNPHDVITKLTSSEQRVLIRKAYECFSGQNARRWHAILGDAFFTLYDGPITQEILDTALDCGVSVEWVAERVKDGAVHEEMELII